MSPDEWQAHVTTDAALAMGRWLEARGRLDRPIASLTRRDLECMASNAVSRFAVLASERRTDAPDEEERERARPAPDGVTRAELGGRVPCVLCGREALGFGYCHGLRWGRHPHHSFCSMACLTAGSANAEGTTA